MADFLSPTANQPGSSSVTEPRKKRDGYASLLTPEDRDMIKRVEERIAPMMRENTRWSLERQMFENIAMYNGVQWIEYSETQKRFQRWNAPSWMPTPVTNLISPRVATMLAGLVRSKPQGRVRPKSNDAEDQQAAKTAEKVIGHIYDVTEEDGLRLDAALISTLTGTVIAEDFFNPNAGRLLQVPRSQPQETPATQPAATCPNCGDVEDPQMTGAPCQVCSTPYEDGTKPVLLPDGSPATTMTDVPMLDEQGAPIVDSYREGEIQSRVRPLFNFFWDAKATKLKDARWCGEALYVDLDWIDENFPEMGPYVGSEEGVEAMNFYEASLLALVGPSIQGTAHQGGMTFFKNGVVLRKYQEKPSQKYPNGLHLIVANGVLLFRGELPIKDEQQQVVNEFTYEEFRYDEVPGRFPGRTPVDDMVPLQKRYNGISAQRILNRKTLLNPWLLAPKGSGLNPGQINMRPGATVLYNWVGIGVAPQVVKGEPLPEQVNAEAAECVQRMDQLAQDPAAVAQADTPAGMKNGVALNFAKEAREEVTLPRLQRWGLWIARRDRKRLLLAQQYYREPRLVKLLGAGEDYRVKYLKGADIRGNVDVSVDPGTLIPRSPSMKQQAVIDALDVGLLQPDDPIKRDKLLRILLGDDVFDTDAGPDRRRAEKENATMEDGTPVQTNEFDDHQVHVLVHQARIKDPSFDYLTPESQQAFIQHTQMHQQAITQAQQQAQEQQLALDAREADIKARGGGSPLASSGGGANSQPQADRQAA